MSKLRKLFLAIALGAPIGGAAGVLLTPRNAEAAEGCNCRDYCNPKLAFCAILVCSDGTSQNCNGEYIEQ